MKIFPAAMFPLLAFMSSGVAFTQTKFASEDAARLHCPIDAVVWLTAPNNVFVRKGDPRYGTTQRGAYICEHDAIAAGDRAAH
jgi:hypothetical protein